MANFGLSRPIIAKLNTETGKYSDAVKCGKAINTTVTPNYNTASLYADDAQQEQVEEFKNASVELGTDSVPVNVANVLFGHNVTEEEETDNSEDAGSYVGYGFITAEMQSGKKKYRACLSTKVKFSEGAESYQTKGDSIQFQTPTLSGTAFADGNGVWRYKSGYVDTVDAAEKWIMKKLGIDTSVEEQQKNTSDTAGSKEIK